jgi:hypothetical protein
MTFRLKEQASIGKEGFSTAPSGEGGADSDRPLALEEHAVASAAITQRPGTSRRAYRKENAFMASTLLL